MNPVLIKGHTARLPVQPYQILKYGSDEGVEPAAAAANKLIGVSGPTPVNVGYAVDVTRLGIAQVLLGGAVSAGDEITSDANGRGVALGAAGESIGRADKAGAAGDVIPVFLRPFTKVAS